MKAGCDKCERVFWKLLEDEPCPWCDAERLKAERDELAQVLRCQVPYRNVSPRAIEILDAMKHEAEAGGGDKC